MDKIEEAKALVNHARQLIEQSEGDAIKQYGSVVVAAEELLKSSHQSGQYATEFLKETSHIHKSQDTLLLVCLGMITNIGFEGDKTSAMPQLNDSNYGFIMSEYYPIKRAANNIRAAELFPNDPPEPEVKASTDDLMKDFEWLMSVTIGRLYKKSPLWKQKLMWQLVKEWNSGRFKTGMPRLVREKLGEDGALELFRDTANRIMNDPELLDKATKDYRESNPYANQ